MLTYKKPLRATVGNLKKEDLYVPVGDAIGFRNMCAWSAETIWDVQLKPLESIRVWISGGKR